MSVGKPDLVWLAERPHAIWTSGKTCNGVHARLIRLLKIDHVLNDFFLSGLQHDESTTKNSWSGSSGNGADPWEIVLFGLLERSRVPARCPTTVLLAWPMLHARINALYTIIEPA